MGVMGERQFTGLNGRNPQTEKSHYVLNITGFWLYDKFWIRADSSPF